MNSVMSNNSEREREIFGEALELGSLEEQRAFVKGACGGDEPLRQAVEGLLEAYSQAGCFIPPRLSDHRDAPRDSTSHEGPGTVIGRYKLLEKIGKGGFGEVWMAEQKEPVKRRVALGLYREAIPLQEKARDYYLAVCGQEHPDTLSTMHNLANSYDEAGRRAETLKLREEVLALRRKVLGPEHPDTLQAMQDLANLYFSVGRSSEATTLLAKVCEGDPKDAAAERALILAEQTARDYQRDIPETARLFRVMSLFRQDKPEEAREALHPGRGTNAPAAQR